MELHARFNTPKGCCNKFRYDPEAGLFVLAGLLPEGMMFPFDFGFIPSTLGEDGDPIDIMVMLEAPAHVGCLIEVRIIGVIMARQTEKGMTRRNDRLLGVAVHSDARAHLKSVRDVSSHLLEQVEEFFVSYNKQRKKTFKIRDIGGPRKALKFLKAGMHTFKKAHEKDKGEQ
ncbi:MAG: inorganic diphosphatase [Nitrospiraceae bacterium]